MADVTLSDISNAMGFNEKEPSKDFSYYGTIVSEDVENDTYQVSINRDPSTTVTASRMAGAKVGDVVIVTVMANGHASVTSCKGGDRDALKAIADAEAAEAKADTAAQKADAIVSDVEAANDRIDGISEDYSILNQDYRQYKIDTDDAIGNVQTRVTNAENALGNKVNVNEYNTQIQSINQNISAMGQTITQQDGRISSAESSITQNAKAITSKVTASVEGAADMVSYINQTASSVKIKAQHIVIDGDLIVGKNYVDGAVDGAVNDLEIGGRNLFYLTPMIENRTVYNCYRLALTENLVKGQKYTIQFWGMTLDSGSTGFHIYWGGGSIRLDDNNTYKKPTNGYWEYTFIAPESTHTDTNNKFINVYNFMNGHSGSNCFIDKWKIEKGDKATDYSIAPEDYQLNDPYNLIVNAKNPRIKHHFPPTVTVSSGGNGVGALVYISDAPLTYKTHQNAYNISYKITGNSSGNRDFQQTISDFSTLGGNGKWKFTAYARAVGSTSITALIRVWGDEQNFTYSQSIPNTWTRIEVPITLSGNIGTRSNLLFGLTGAGGIEYVDPRLTRVTPDKSFYCTCDTAAATVDKVVSAPKDLALTAGTYLNVRFTYGNTADTMKLNVNSLGSKPVSANYSYTTTGKLNLPAQATATFMYTGTEWRFISTDNVTNMLKFTATDGLKIMNVGDQTDYVQIKSTNISIYRANNEKLRIEDSFVRVGTTTDNATINSNGVKIYKAINNNQQVVAEFGESAIIRGGIETGYSSGDRYIQYNYVKMQGDKIILGHYREDIGSEDVAITDSCGVVISSDGSVGIDYLNSRKTTTDSLTILKSMCENIRSGMTSSITVAAKSYADVTVNFVPMPLDVIPNVIVGFRSTSTAAGLGSCSCAVHSITSTSFKIRVFNNDTSQRAPIVYWIATDLSAWSN